MARTCTSGIVTKAIESERARAYTQGVRREVVDQAADATCRALAGAAGSDRWLRLRVERYFWAVVRRTLTRRRIDPHVTARFVLASVVEDLSASGWDDSAVWSEIERGWSDRVPVDVLEEYRVRLCA